jgi:hypothetical protein
MSERDHWTFGTAMIIKGVSRAIHGGFLQPLRRIPILTRVPERVALYLITIDEGEYYLDKEHGVVGWPRTPCRSGVAAARPSPGLRGVHSR